MIFNTIFKKIQKFELLNVNELFSRNQAFQFTIHNI